MFKDTIAKPKDNAVQKRLWDTGERKVLASLASEEPFAMPRVNLDIRSIIPAIGAEISAST